MITQDDVDTNGNNDDGDIDNTATADSNETGPEDDSEEVPLDLVQPRLRSCSKTSRSPTVNTNRGQDIRDSSTSGE